MRQKILAMKFNIDSKADDKEASNLTGSQVTLPNILTKKPGNLNFKQTKNQYKCTQYVLYWFIHLFDNLSWTHTIRERLSCDGKKEQLNIVFQIPRMKLKVICLISRNVKTGKRIAFIPYSLNANTVLQVFPVSSCQTYLRYVSKNLFSLLSSHCCCSVQALISVTWNIVKQLLATLYTTSLSSFIWLVMLPLQLSGSKCK